MSEKTLKFDNITVNKEEFHKSNLSDKFKHRDDIFKYFIGCKEGKIVKPLCIISFEMSGYIKHFEKERKNMFFWLKITMCWINTMNIGTRLRIS